MAGYSIGWPRDSWIQTGGNNWTYQLKIDWVQYNQATTNYWYTINSTASTQISIPAMTAYSGTPITMGTHFVPASPSIQVRSAAEVAIADAAEKASEQLVRYLVGEDGYKLWKQLGYIQIESKTRPGIVYRVKSDAIDLFQKKDGTIIDLRQWLCVHPKPLDKSVYPVGDEVATRVLLARFDEDELWSTANLHERSHANQPSRTLTRQEQLARYRQLASIAA